jgi:hypothetical protein
MRPGRHTAEVVGLHEERTRLKSAAARVEKSALVGWRVHLPVVSCGACSFARVLVHAGLQREAFGLGELREQQSLLQNREVRLHERLQRERGLLSTEAADADLLVKGAPLRKQGRVL